MEPDQSQTQAMNNATNEFHPTDLFAYQGKYLYIAREQQEEV